MQRTGTVVAEAEARNLRPRPPRNPVQNANEEIYQNAIEEIEEGDLDCEPIGDFLCANDGISLVFCYVFQHNHILPF